METEQEAPTAATDDINGLIRRVRRLAKWSQRELAQELGVSQSAVAKWETGRTCPSARMLARILGLVELALAAVKAGGDQVRPMKKVAARDAADRRYPAHTFVWAEGWWAPEGAEMTAWFTPILARSADLELPKVRYSRRWGAFRRPTDMQGPSHRAFRKPNPNQRRASFALNHHATPIQTANPIAPTATTPTSQ